MAISVVKRRVSLMALLAATALLTAVLMCGCSSSRSGSDPTLVYFRAANCPYCKQMTPIVDEIGREYGNQLKVVYAEVDQLEGKNLASHHGIIGYPTILLLDREGERAGLLRGVVPQISLKKAVDGLFEGQQ